MKAFLGVTFLTISLLGCGASPAHESGSQLHTFASEVPDANMERLPARDEAETAPKYGFRETAESTNVQEICERLESFEYQTMAEDIEKGRGSSIIPTLYASMLAPCYNLKSYRYRDQNHKQVLLKFDAASGWTVTTLVPNDFTGELARGETSPFVVIGEEVATELANIPDDQEWLAWVTMMKNDDDQWCLRAVNVYKISATFPK